MVRTYKSIAGHLYGLQLVSDYLYKQQNQVQGLIEEDELCYEIQDLHVFDLGEQVEFQGRTYYVTECRESSGRSSAVEYIPDQNKVGDTGTADL